MKIILIALLLSGCTVCARGECPVFPNAAERQ